MKKSIITIMAIICMLVAVGGVFYTKNYYENKISIISEQYDSTVETLINEKHKLINEKHKLINENDELERDIKDMNKEVYNLMNDKAYKIEIRHDNVTYIYEQEKDGIFAYSTTTVIK